MKDKDKDKNNTKGKKEITIFFSWQSDLPKTHTTSVIRKGVEYAKKKIEIKNQNLLITLEEATRNVSGSPDIPKTIFDKIVNSDIFICDITTIHVEKQIKRKTPNPNVLLELGFASAILGWGRIIMLYNKNFGDFNRETPFDLEKKRITCYEFPTENFNIKDFGDLITNAINLVIKNNPLKFIQTLNQPELTKRSRDIANLLMLLEYVHIPSIDEYFSRLPSVFTSSVLDFYEDFRSTVGNSLFHIYDPKLRNLINRIMQHWNILFSFDDRYTYNSRSKNYVFLLPGDVFPSEEHRKDWEKIDFERDKMSKVFQRFLEYVREHYLEIDLEGTSKNALKKYIEDEKAFNEKMDLNVKTLKNRN